MKSESFLISPIAVTIDFFIGRNKDENSEIIDMSHADDIWFHLDGHPSCHVIARLPSVTIPRKFLHSIIKRGALLCKQNSKFKSGKNIPVIYTAIKNIRKTEHAGSVVCLKKKIIFI